MKPDFYVLDIRGILGKKQSAVIAPRSCATAAFIDEFADAGRNPFSLLHGTSAQSIRLISGNILNKHGNVIIKELGSADVAECLLNDIRAVEGTKLDLHELNLLGYPSLEELLSQFASYGEKLWFFQLQLKVDASASQHSHGDAGTSNTVLHQILRVIAKMPFAGRHFSWGGDRLAKSTQQGTQWFSRFFAVWGRVKSCDCAQIAGRIASAGNTDMCHTYPGNFESRPSIRNNYSVRLQLSKY